MPKVERVPCKRCGELTDFTGTKLCQQHWELERRIETEPRMSLTILRECLEHKVVEVDGKAYYAFPIGLEKK